MGDIVNLNKFRKKKNRSSSEKQAKENRVAFGRTGSQKKADADKENKHQTSIDNRKLSKKKLPSDTQDDNI